MDMRQVRPFPSPSPETVLTRATAGSQMEYDMDAHAMLHGLQAKSSGQFGMMEGQGMHFLIPDMPPVVQGERGGVDE